MKNRLIRILALLIVFDPCQGQFPDTSSEPDINQWSGRWFCIASYPSRRSRDCRCSTTEIRMIPLENGFSVINRCSRYKNQVFRLTSSTGKAKPVKGYGNTRFRVRYFWPCHVEYQITGHAADYSWALVGQTEKKYVWVFSRTSYVTSDTYDIILRVIADQGYDTESLVMTPQNCDNP